MKEINRKENRRGKLKKKIIVYANNHMPTFAYLKKTKIY